MWPFKRKQTEIKYLESTPHWQPLGSIEGNLYFIEVWSGDIYSLHKDFSTHSVVLSLITNLQRR